MNEKLDLAAYCVRHAAELNASLGLFYHSSIGGSTSSSIGGSTSSICIRRSVNSNGSGRDSGENSIRCDSILNGNDIGKDFAKQRYNTPNPPNVNNEPLLLLALVSKSPK